MAATTDFKLQAEEFYTRAAALGFAETRDYFWYHTIELPHGLVTPGEYDFRKTYALYGFPSDMKGMRVLDIGPATGFFTFEFLRRGAQVLSLELPDLNSLDRFPGQNLGHTVHKLRRMLAQDDTLVIPPGKEQEAAADLYRRLLSGPFEFCDKMLGLRAQRHYSTVYNLSAAEIGTFDMVFMGDILLHTINPLAALAAVAPLCDNLLVLAQAMPESPDGKPAMRYASAGNPDIDEVQYWQPDALCLTQMLEKLGFTASVHARPSVTLRPSGHTFEHTVLRAVRKHSRVINNEIVKAGDATVPPLPFTGERYVPQLGGDIRLEHLHRYALARELARGKSVLDIACGEGYGANLLAAVAADVTGVDTAQDAVSHARIKYKRDNLSFKTGSCLQIPMQNKSVDLAICFETLEHIAEHEKFMAELRRVLKPGGLLVISTPNSTEYEANGKNPFHIKELTAGEFCQLLGSHFKNVEICGQRVAYGSHIVSKGGNPSQPFMVFSGIGDKVEKTDGLHSPPYLLAFAGDNAMPALPASLFDGTELYKKKDRIIIANNREIEKLGKWGTGLDREIAELRNEITRLHANCEEKDQKISEIIHSQSWRVTAPLIFLGNAVRKLRGKQPKNGNNSSYTTRRMTSSIRIFMAPKLFSLCAKVYRHLPFSPGFKQRAKTVFMKFFRGFIGTTQSSAHEPQGEFWAGLPSYPLRFKDIQTPEVTIIIPICGGARITYNCLESILANTGEFHYEVLAIDDNSQDMTPRMLASMPGLRFLRNHKNIGFLKSCNKAAKEARGKYLVFLNNDTLVKPRWLEELVATLENTPSAGMVGAKLLSPDGTLLEAGGIVWRDASAWNLGRGEDASKPEYNYLRDADYCSGACIAIGRKLWERFGGFDERYAPAYFEDTDLAFRVREAGLRVIYQPLAQVIHIEKMSHGTDSAERLMETNRAKFAERWKDVLMKHRPNAENPHEEMERGVIKRILIIDSRTITPDQDSGSLDVLQQLKIFQTLGYKATFAPDNLTHAGRYTEDLQRIGVECLYYPHVSSISAHLKQHGCLYDAVIIYRPYIAANHIDAVRHHCPRARIIYDTVDLHFLREQRQAELERNPALMSKALETRAQELKMAAKADCTIVLNKQEKDILLQHNPALHVEVLRPSRDMRAPTVPFDNRRDIMFVGGYQHPPNVDAMLYFTKEVFPQLRNLLPGVKLYILGSQAPQAVTKLACNDILVPGYLPDIYPFFESCRLSIAPLRYGAGVKGKIIQSLACGLPCVASSIACEGMELEEGQDILAADSADDFAKTVTRLYTDKALWERLSRSGFETVQRLYSIEAATDKLREILQHSNSPLEHEKSRAVPSR